MAKKSKTKELKAAKKKTKEEAEAEKLLKQRESLDALTHLGSGQTTYAFQKPTSEMFDTFPNPSDANYIVEFFTNEFTSLCPKTGQPDFAEVKICYTPEEVCVETKSMKLYLFAYRNEGAFMEKICNKIADDLEKALEPRWLSVEMIFNARGGIATKVYAQRGDLVS